jgi:hypothetical protein
VAHFVLHHRINILKEAQKHDRIFPMRKRGDARVKDRFTTVVSVYKKFAAIKGAQA